MMAVVGQFLLKRFFTYCFPFAKPFASFNEAVIVISAVCWLLAVLPGLSAALLAARNGVYYSMPIFRLPEFLIGACIYLTIRLGFTYRISTSSSRACDFFALSGSCGAENAYLCRPQLDCSACYCFYDFLLVE